MNQNKPELLLPAGNVESFYAALRGGADAVYLGMKNFNARGRAMNFSPSQVLAAIQEAHSKNVKVYITLNTVVKNNELNELAETLQFLDKVKVDAVIVQDWGVYLLAKKFFPKLKLHASTQMGNHNSIGVNFAKVKGIKRTVLARELTLPELSKIAASVDSELELFVHGALCYSFSGMCLFSSYLGGQGANRGMCAQPCRTIYNETNRTSPFFSLKDNLQIANLRKFSNLGIYSLKVEGRMKPADYVYRVAKSYRMALDNFDKTTEANELLQQDFGREKTAYFLGKEVKNSISSKSETGIEIGKVLEVKGKNILISSNTILKPGNRLRIRNTVDFSNSLLRIGEIGKIKENYLLTGVEKPGIASGSTIYLVGTEEEKFPTTFKNLPPPSSFILDRNLKQKISEFLMVKKMPVTPRLYLRIDDPSWFRKLRLEETNELILSFRRKDWEKLDWSDPFLLENKQRISIELPKFISENQLEYYRLFTRKCLDNGFRSFFISHLSQKMLLPEGVHISANENVYVYNDAAARLMDDERLNGFCYPLENDWENLQTMRNRNGIVSVYYYPELFFSRMPVKINHPEGKFRDDNRRLYRKVTRDGITIVIPDSPVALTQYKKQLMDAGFHKFLIDLRFDKPTGNLIKKVMTQFQKGEPVHPSTTFNFKKGLK